MAVENPIWEFSVNSGLLTLGVVLGIIAIFARVMLPRIVVRFKHRLEVKNEGVAEKIGSISVIIRDGEMLTKKKGRITREGFLIADKRSWILDDVKPYFLRDGMTTRPCLIVDARKQVYYRFTNTENSKQREIAGYASDPNLLRRFTESQVVQKLTTARPDKTAMFMMFVMGIFAFFLIQQFIPK